MAGARPRTLPAAVVPVAVGAACAAGTGEAFGDDVVWWRVAAALAVALLLQIGVNYANDYSDGVRGTDDVRVGPMRLVATGTASPAAVKRAALGVLAAAAVVGLVLAIATSWWLLAVGALAIVAAWGYTGGPKPYGYLGLGEVFVFVFFGLVATVGTTYVAFERVPAVTWVAATGVGFLACALLVVNNLRDIPGDTVAGKRTLAVRIGDRPTRTVFTAMHLAAMFVTVMVTVEFERAAVVALVGVPFAYSAVRSVVRGASGAALIPVLGATGRVQLISGLAMAVGVAATG